LGLVEGNTYIGLLVEESNTLLGWGNMVERETEAKSSGSGVTNPYRRTEHCDKIHAYRCDKEVGVDVSKEHLITSRGRVRNYENNLKGYEEILVSSARHQLGRSSIKTTSVILYKHNLSKRYLGVIKNNE
jgi:hypothetical protein